MKEEPMNRSTAALVVVGVAVAISGCAGGGGPVESPASPTSSSIMASPTGTAAWTMEDAGREYLAMVEPSNAANAKLRTVSGREGATLKEVTAACRQAADAVKQLMVDLQAGRWPEEVKPDAAAFAVALAENAAGNELCADASDVSAIEKGFEKSAGSGVSEAAAALRAALGLAPAPGE